MNGFLFDTNVLLDIATGDPVWLPWSSAQVSSALAQGPALINPIIYAEFAPAFATAGELDNWLDPAVFQRLPLPYAAGWLASQAWMKYRKRGAHASRLRLLVTLPNKRIRGGGKLERRRLD
jgi:hypothetical protein